MAITYIMPPSPFIPQLAAQALDVHPVCVWTYTLVFQERLVCKRVIVNANFRLNLIVSGHYVSAGAYGYLQVTEDSCSAVKHYARGACSRAFCP